MVATSKVNVRKLEGAHPVLVEIHVTHEFRLRIFIFSMLLKIAGWILGCGIVIKKV